MEARTLEVETAARMVAPETVGRGREKEIVKKKKMGLCYRVQERRKKEQGDEHEILKRVPLAEYDDAYVPQPHFVGAYVETNAMVAADDARKCESLSHNFNGLCLSESNCASVCATEGFTGGDCRGLRRRCFCTKQC
uniref:uncharacterized protein LOC105350880 n=1 Tax=Fragaria vesca subsp. vesca TaxID=101020 RepID=UPI0005CB3E17|nr:PREDICTED: uncharacterized protein LOC105350880 [Fragaria vesca subsp. vesca]